MKATRRLKYQHFGLTVYEINGQEWAVGDDTIKSWNKKGYTRVDRAARRAVIRDLWAFRSDYIASFLVGHVNHFHRLRAADLADVLKMVQEKLCDDAQPLVRAFLGDQLRLFVDAALDSDGRGHFLSSYNGQEVASDTIEGLPKGKIAFRLN